MLLEILEAEGLIKVAGAIPTSVRFTPAGLISAEEAFTVTRGLCARLCRHVL